MIQLWMVLFLSTLYFSIGIMGILVARGGIKLLMSVEIIINAANINILAWALNINDSNGIFFVLLSIAIAAAESVIGFAILVALYRKGKGINLAKLTDLRW
ncbi:MAG: NADH-quinone oxidoreductase subunit NuoK [Thermoplasmata archaeon]